MQKSENTFLEGRIFPPLIKFAIPLLLSILLQALYGAVDLIIVGKFGTTSSVSAVSNGSQIMHAVTSAIIGLTVGVTVLIGRYVGSKDDERAAATVGAMVRVFSIIAIILTILLTALSEQIALVMRVPEEAMEKTVVYLRICSAGTVFIVAFNAISGLFRGLGNSKSPLLFITVACGINVVLDLVLVGAFKMDATGAAMATVFSQAGSVAFSLWKIKKDGLPFKVTKKHFAKNVGYQKKILKTGTPLAAQELLISISFLIIMSIINNIGLVASASIGIAQKLFLFLAIVPISFMSALSAFVAQNIGAGQEKRAIKSVGIAMAVSLVFGLCMAALTYFRGDMLAAIFENNSEVIAATHLYLKGVSLEYLMLPVIFCFLGYFNGIGQTTFVFLEGFVSSFIFRIPVSYYISRQPWANLFHIGLAVPISAASSLIMCLTYFFIVRKKRLRL
jgi:putative MATE family efflux protein